MNEETAGSAGFAHACEIQWDALKAAFENHSGGAKALLDRETGEVFDVQEGRDPNGNKAHYLTVVPVPSRVQYQMMELFIGTVASEQLHALLQDTIVGKGAFRRFKDALAKFPMVRKRWFTFRDALLHQHILQWLEDNHVHYENRPDWNLALPPALPDEESGGGELPCAAEPVSESKPLPPEEVEAFVMAWAQRRGEDFGYLFGPVAFQELSRDLNQTFSFFKRV